MTTVRLRRACLALVALSLTSCAFFSPEIRLPTHGLPVNAAGLATGGRLELEGQCVFLAHEGGSRANLLWPSGYTATGPPLVVHDSAGQRVMSEGDTVELGVAEAGTMAVPGCPARGTWAIGEVGRVNGLAIPSSPVGPDRPKNPPR